MQRDFFRCLITKNRHRKLISEKNYKRKLPTKALQDEFFILQYCQIELKIFSSVKSA